jgi:hypothetical protein
MIKPIMKVIRRTITHGVTIEHHLRGVTNVIENQFGFMPGRSTMEVIFLIMQLMEMCREQKERHAYDLY